MDKMISSVTLEINGRTHPAKSVNPTQERYRTPVSVVGGRGYIENEPDYGMEITFVESKVKAFTPDIRDMTNGTVSIVYDDGSREVYTGCVTLDRVRSGYTINNEATVTYKIASEKPLES
jgi:hypothetical protein